MPAISQTKRRRADSAAGAVANNATRLRSAAFGSPQRALSNGRTNAAGADRLGSGFGQDLDGSLDLFVQIAAPANDRFRSVAKFPNRVGQGFDRVRRQVGLQIDGDVFEVRQEWDELLLGFVRGRVR